MNLFTVFFALVLAVATVAGQRFGFPHTSQFGLASLTGDFGGPSAFGGQDLSGTLNAGIRDPRQNRGPVVFPPAPADAPVESSGVIVGASGYGFVPPNTPQKFRKKAPPYRYPPAPWKLPVPAAASTGTSQRPKKPGIVKLTPTVPIGGYKKPTPPKWFRFYKGPGTAPVRKPPPVPPPAPHGLGYGGSSVFVGRPKAVATSVSYATRH
ncbi:proline-rich receptor-like protein kinase PERK13 [Anopheles arabiensis]|uniref:proline-rich receptor-like protein kinase PERK13 n=1 Tax=Anopheles arabiensis TaxID=7173 RepID=UPI001AAD8187|nr:proline-rich receptor-like protein kinase PERK13 [Anopheles arabiensis]